MTFKPQTVHYLAGYISDAATTIRLDYDDGLPPSGTLRVGSEYLSYTSRSSGYLYGVQRGLYGSTATAHNEAELVYWIQGVGQILYGPAAVTPDGMKDATYRAAARPIWRGNPNTPPCEIFSTPPTGMESSPLRKEKRRHQPAHYQYHQLLFRSSLQPVFNYFV